MHLINNLANLFNNKKLDEYINLLIVTPLLYLIQTNWVNYSIVALI